MPQSHRSGLFFLILALLFPPQWVSGAAVYPVKASGDGRYLVDQSGAAYLVNGDSPHSLVVNLSSADAAGYLADRAAHGFNTVWVEALCVPYTGGRSDGSTYDGILPFTRTLGTGDYDLSWPNEAYFERVDAVVSNAANYGIEVFLDPIDTAGWNNVIGDNGSNRCRLYGQYLGNRYKGYDNIVWMNGNDYEWWTNANYDGVVLQVVAGIRDYDTRHLQTVELNYKVSSSLDDSRWGPVLGMNSAYTYYPTYAQILLDYNRTNYLPDCMVEANYEFENDYTGDETLRRQEYWPMTCGATGQVYGNHYIWAFSSGWQSKLDTSGVTQLGYWKQFFEGRAWYSLVPDTNHVLVTAGYGTYTNAGSVNDSDYATAARTRDGSLAVVYVPAVRALTVDMGQMNGGSVTARWFDPANGTYRPISGSPFATAGTQNFTPPGNNSEGDPDWVLVLESFVPTSGTYNGLFSVTNQIEQDNEGYFTATITPKARYTGHIQIGGAVYPFSGSVATGGELTNVIRRAGSTPLWLDLQFGTGNEADQLTGSLSNALWVANVTADRATFNSRTNPAPYTNYYTFAIATAAGDPWPFAGSGFGTLRVGPGGNATFSGKLADGSVFSHVVPISSRGTGPLYVPLYSGQGSVWSWLSFDTNQPGSDLSGALTWIRPANRHALRYASGFTNSACALAGSIYRPPHGANVLDQPYAGVEFYGGNLASAFTNLIALSTLNRVTNLTAANRLAMTFAASKGTFSGSVTDPSTGRTRTFSGAVLQKQGAGYGFMLVTNQSSQVTLLPLN